MLGVCFERGTGGGREVKEIEGVKDRKDELGAFCAEAGLNGGNANLTRHTSTGAISCQQLFLWYTFERFGEILRAAMG
jgi:hypothetical protein